jgi:hypothetical protein
MHPLSMNLISILALACVPILIVMVGLVVGRFISSSSLAPAQARSDLRVVRGEDVDRAA